jgi:hypothetical protein
MHTVVETSVYLREASKLLSDAERKRVVSTIAKDPEIGDLIAGTGGFRKIRIALQGGGKSGGFRVIYYFCDETMPVFLMQIYAKNEKANLSAAEKNQLKKLSEEFKRRHRRWGMGRMFDDLKEGLAEADAFMSEENTGAKVHIRKIA